ncbi:MAG: LamG domain-containing protein [Candidatus Poribacteria bacterium]|nr:LamG domain-containing protein [Candidatus Poribacteria bacterium]
MKYSAKNDRILTNIAMCVMLFTVIFTTDICFANDLVLHLSFDEMKGDVVEDLSEFGNDATFKGKTQLVDGKFGKALDFDGASWGEIADHSSLDITDGITVEFWANLRPSAGGPGSDVQTGLEKGTGWKAGLYTLAAWYRGGSLLQFFDLPADCRDLNIGDNIQDETWHFLAGTWDGTTIKLYIDGELNKELECKGTLNPNDDPLFIGARGGTQRFVNGALDEIKIYNYPLTEEELLTDMENPNAAAVLPKDKLTTTWARLKSK